MRQQNLFAKAVDKTRCRENNNGGVSLRDQKIFSKCGGQTRLESIYASAKMSTRNRKYFLEIRWTKLVLKAIRSFAECPPQKIKKFFSKSVDKFGFVEKYIRDVENSKETVEVFIDVKMRQNN